jgi:tetratricopeptide (TPR) repeat protein
VARALNEIEIKLNSGDAKGAREAERAASKGLLAIPDLVAQRGELFKLQETWGGLTLDPRRKHAEAEIKGKDKLKAAEDAAANGEWDAAKAALAEAQQQYEFLKDQAQQIVAKTLAKAQVEIDQRQPDTALKTIEEVLTVDPENAKAKALKTSILAANADFNALLAQANLELSNAKRLLQLWENQIATTQDVLERFHAAETAFAGALRLKPQDEAARKGSQEAKAGLEKIRGGAPAPPK